MTLKPFWIDPYLSRHETSVASAAGSDIILRPTIFFAFSGGQESDQGPIAGYPVLRGRRRGKPQHPPPPPRGARPREPWRNCSGEER